MNFYFFDFNHFRYFFLDRLLRNCIKLIIIGLVLLPVYVGWGESYWPTQNKLPLKSPALEP